MSTQQEKAQAFRALHERPGAFIIPNPGMLVRRASSPTSASRLWQPRAWGTPSPWDGRTNTLNRAETLAHASAIVSATRLPVSADLENGFADDPKVVAETIRFAAAAGLVGGSIEDATGCPDDPICEIEHAVERG
jgi:2-methylisocitrate lyase-like PEP mutase family enzyme